MVNNEGSFLPPRVFRYYCTFNTAGPTFLRDFFGSRPLYHVSERYIYIDTGTAFCDRKILVELSSRGLDRKSEMKPRMRWISLDVVITHPPPLVFVVFDPYDEIRRY